MKQVFLIALATMAGYVHTTKAQSVFNQNQTMLERGIKQIMLLKTYTGYLEKGYKIVNGGWNAVKEIKNGEWNLHGIYYGSLATVNPKIAGYDNVHAILSRSEKTMQIGKATLLEANQAGILTPAEKTALRNTMDNLCRDVLSSLNRLELILTNNKLKMTDDERLKAIDELDESAIKNLRAAKGISRQIAVIVSSRKKAKEETIRLKQWYGLSDKN